MRSNALRLFLYEVRLNGLDRTRILLPLLKYTILQKSPGKHVTGPGAFMEWKH